MRRRDRSKKTRTDLLSESEKSVLAVAGNVHEKMATAGFAARFRVVGIGESRRLVVTCHTQRTAKVSALTVCEAGVWLVMEGEFRPRSGGVIPCHTPDEFVTLALAACGARDNKHQSPGKPPDVAKTELNQARNEFDYKTRGGRTIRNQSPFMDG